MLSSILDFAPAIPVMDSSFDFMLMFVFFCSTRADELLVLLACFQIYSREFQNSIEISTYKMTVYYLGQ